jgi:hypothetical protein
VAHWSFEATRSAPGEGRRAVGRSCTHIDTTIAAAREPRIDSPGLGLGLPVISQMSASSQIVSPEDGGTEVIMRFDLREQEEGRR